MNSPQDQPRPQGAFSWLWVGRVKPGKSALGTRLPQDMNAGRLKKDGIKRNKNCMQSACARAQYLRKSKEEQLFGREVKSR